MKVCHILLVFLLFVGCAKHYELQNMKDFNEASFIIKKGASKEFLNISKTKNGYKFVIFDTLGIPKARRVFENGKIVSEGFLPPNSSANELFLKALEMVSLDMHVLDYELNKTSYRIERIDVFK